MYGTRNSFLIAACLVLTCSTSLRAQAIDSRCHAIANQWTEIAKRDAMMMIPFKEAVLNAISARQNVNAVKCAYMTRLSRDAAEVSRLQRLEGRLCPNLQVYDVEQTTRMAMHTREEAAADCRAR